MSAYHRPRSLEEALAIRAAGAVTIIAGGTDIYPAAAARRGWGDPAQQDMLDISAIPGLDRIEETAAGWRIGCLVTWSRLIAAPLPPLFDGLKAAAHDVGGAQVQNRGTLVGNLCTASPAADGIPNLLALDAAVEIAGAAGARLVPIGSFHTGYRATALRPEEIVTALHVPRLDGARSGFRKLGARRYLVISIAMAAAVVVTEGGVIRECRIAVGACHQKAQRLRLLELALRGAPAGEAAGLVQPEHFARLRPITDMRATAAYRHAASRQAVRDLLRQLA